MSAEAAQPGVCPSCGGDGKDHTDEHRERFRKTMDAYSNGPHVKRTEEIYNGRCGCGSISGGLGGVWRDPLCVALAKEAGYEG